MNQWPHVAEDGGRIQHRWRPQVHAAITRVHIGEHWSLEMKALLPFVDWTGENERHSQMNVCYKRK